MSGIQHETHVRLKGFRLEVTKLSHMAATQTPGIPNLGVARHAQVNDQGQISRLLARLQDHGLLENTGGPTAGSNAWRLTHSGEELLSTSHPFSTSVPTTKETR
jgi:hypothetical protein